MDEKQRFVVMAESGRFPMTQLCEDFKISRKTGYKYLKRYRSEGTDGLAQRSRRPQSSPYSTDERVVQLLLNERRLHPFWGPKKLRRLLVREHGVSRPPALSTIARLLHQYGLSQPRKRRPGAYRIRPEHLTEPTAPNEVWTVDFKGWFTLKNAQRCDPLTVCDRYSRYVIACHARPNQQFKGTLKAFRAMMRHHGLPRVIRVDNGAPFASGALGGLSRLSVWWIEQGIEVEFLTPASPQENGSHERMHRDLKSEATKPPSKNMSAQQKRFIRWRDEYNHYRPHEALDMLTPSDFYQPSARRLGEKYKIDYPDNSIRKRVGENGYIKHEGTSYYVGDIFAGCQMALIETPENGTELHYANMHLGNLTFDGAAPFGPTALISRPHRKPSTQQSAKKKTTKV